MTQRSIVLVLVLFALLIVGMFIFAGLKGAELEQVPSDVVIPSSDELISDQGIEAIETIEARYIYVDGTYTIVGNIILPTRCDVLKTDATVLESFPEQVILDFSVINNSNTCAQIPTAQRFSINLAASESAVFKARLMGRYVKINLTPVNGPIFKL